MRVAPDPESPSRETEDDSNGSLEDSTALARDGAKAMAASTTAPALGSLLASARHELRSPLQSIQGFAELLSSEAYGSLGTEQHTFVEHILEGSAELSAMLDACLELTELELLREPLALALLDVRTTLNESLARASEAAKTPAHAQLGRSLQHTLAWLDAAALVRAFRALLSTLGANAIKPFRISAEAEGEYTCLRFSSATRTPAPLISVAELAERRRTARSLIWLRLSSVLLERQGGQLQVSESLDYAEVRLHLSQTH